MSRKKIFLVLSFFLVVVFLVIAFLPKPATKADQKKLIWGYVTYEGNRDSSDYVGIWDVQSGNPLYTVSIREYQNPHSFMYQRLYPPQGPEGWYWVQGRGRLSNSDWTHVYFDWNDTQVDLIMWAYEPDK
jgi:hypothetical protein